MEQKKINNTFRMNPNVMKVLKILAAKENRSTTNMLETLILRASEQKEPSNE